MSKNIQISIDLFQDLIDYFLNGQTDVAQFQMIKSQLSAKLEALQRRALFSGYKSSSGSDREQLRTAYLDSVGMLPGFRSDREMNFCDEIEFLRSSNSEMHG